MNARMEQTPDGGKRLTVEFTRHDLLSVTLDKFDLWQMATPPGSIADVLLDAELIARRLEQADRAREAT